MEIEKRTPRKKVEKMAGGGKRGRKVSRKGGKGEEDGCLVDCGIGGEDGKKLETDEVVVDVEREKLEVDFIV